MMETIEDSVCVPVYTDYEAAVALVLVYQNFVRYEGWKSKQSERSELGRKLVESGFQRKRDHLSRKETSLKREKRYQNLVQTHNSRYEILDFYSSTPQNNLTNNWRDYDAIELTSPIYGTGRFLVPNSERAKSRDIPLSNTIHVSHMNVTPNEYYVASSGIDFSSFFKLAEMVAFPPPADAVLLSDQTFSFPDVDPDLDILRKRRVPGTSRLRRRRRFRRCRRVMRFGEIPSTIIGTDLSELVES